ncbi:MAG TPA: hypothetical protein VGW57_12290 [Chthoniobacterales bacterium]|nr:hypothetical protein [Chthoniobacterales bacterium]
MTWRQISDDVVVMSFPWRVLGIDFRRNVTLLRLSDGRVVVHSTAPFGVEDIAAIRSFGEPAWLLDATLMHDTFAKEGRAALPELPYLAPAGFAEVSGLPTALLSPAPPEWGDEIEVIKIEGTRKNEHALFHRSSRTLVVADVFFSMPPETQGWPRFFARHFMRLPRLFGISAFFRLIINDRPAFERSVNRLVELEFEKLIVAHWEPVVRDAKATVQWALRDFGFAK